MTLRVHPFTTLVTLWRYTGALLAPIIISSLTDRRLPALLFSQAVTVIAVTVIAVRESVVDKLSICDTNWSYTSGAVFLRTVSFRVEDISAVECSAVAPGVRRVTVYTRRNRPLATLYLSRKNALRLTDLFPIDTAHKLPTASIIQIIASSAADSSPSGGLLLLSAFLSGLGRQLSLSQVVTDLGNRLPWAPIGVAFIIRTAAAAALTGYVTAFFVSLCRRTFLRVQLDSALNISGGLPIKRSRYIKHPSYINCRRTAMMTALGRSSLTVEAVGSKHYPADLIPAADITLGANRQKHAICPPRRTLRRAYLWPLIRLSAIICVICGLGFAYREARGYLILLSIAITASYAARIYARVYCARHSYLHFSKLPALLTRRGSTLLHAKLCRPPCALSVVSGPFDRRFNVATVSLFAQTGGRKIKIKNIPNRHFDKLM